MVVSYGCFKTELNIMDLTLMFGFFSPYRELRLFYEADATKPLSEEARVTAGILTRSPLQNLLRRRDNNKIFDDTRPSHKLWMRVGGLESPSDAFFEYVASSSPTVRHCRMKLVYPGSKGIYKCVGIPIRMEAHQFIEHTSLIS